MVDKLLISLILLAIFSVSLSVPDTSIPQAVGILSNSSYLSMALTLELGPKDLIPPSPYLTIFAPNDSAFASSGQPSLSLLQLHFSPLSFSPSSLKSLPLGSKIPTRSANRSLIVTSSQFDNHVSLSGVKINDLAIFDDGSLRIFGIEKFFDLNYPVSESEDGNHTTGPTGSVSSQIKSSMVNKKLLKILVAFSSLFICFWEF